MENILKFHSKIRGMSCSFCVETIKKSYKREKGIKNVNVSLSHEEVLVEYDSKIQNSQKIQKVLTDLGYKLQDPRRIKDFEERERELKQSKRQLLVAALFSIISLVFMIVMWSGTKKWWFRYPMLILALFTMFGPGFHIKQKAWQALIRRILNQHNLLEFGAFAGLIGGLLGFFIPYFEPTIPDFFGVSIFLTTYHLLGGWVSLLVRTRASQAVQKLLNLQPASAMVIENGEEIEKKIDDINVGDIIRIRPGERFPIDGVIIKGTTTVDESIVTGESFPVEKQENSEVISGSINQFGTIDIKVNNVGENTFLYKIVRQVEEAKALKPSILIIVDKILKYFVPCVLIISTGAFVFWTFSSFLLFDSIDIYRSVFAALAVLVMGYPCALGMAMPLALIWGGGKAAEKGILIRSGEAYQSFPKIDVIVLDKTGTITNGRPEVIRIISKNFNANEVLSYIAGIEKLSEHPIAKAITHYADIKAINYTEPDTFKAIPGKGVISRLESSEIIIGKPSFLAENNIKINNFYIKNIQKHSEQGHTVILISKDKIIIGIIVLADTIKDDITQTIMDLKNINIEPIMLTGDNQPTAKAIAHKVGIEKYYAEKLPEQKAEIIMDLQKQEKKVAMVGDGINDAPSLMQSDVGIAIGTGADIAIESSDIIITGSKTNKIIEALCITKKSYLKTKQNLILAFIFNGIGVPAAATGLIHPIWAMIAMAASITTVLLNSFGNIIVSKTKRKMVNNKSSIKIFIPGISCERCKKTIIASLKSTQGIINQKVDLPLKILSFDFDKNICDLKNIEKKLKKEYGDIYILNKA